MLDFRDVSIKYGVSFLVAITLALSSSVLADDYDIFTAQGYRWVMVDGPYACHYQQDTERITNHYTDAAELDVVQNVRCYYLIPGTIVRLVNQDSSRGLSLVRIADVPAPLWTYTRFLTKHPVRDLYGVIETPESSGLLPTATLTLPLPSDSPVPWTQSKGNP